MILVDDTKPPKSIAAVAGRVNHPEEGRPRSSRKTKSWNEGHSSPDHRRNDEKVRHAQKASDSLQKGKFDPGG